MEKDKVCHVVKAGNMLARFGWPLTLMSGRRICRKHGDEAVTLLLDTHSYLWWLTDPNLLSTPAALAIGDPTNRVLVSMVSLWEIAIKRVIGKLKAPIDLQND